jgi:hypothetical protein
MTSKPSRDRQTWRRIVKGSIDLTIYVWNNVGNQLSPVIASEAKQSPA